MAQTASVTEAKLKQADACLAYHFMLQAAYVVLASVLTFFVQVSFPLAFGLGSSENYSVNYIALTGTLGTLFCVFNQSTEMLLLVENRHQLNFVRSLSTTIL